jgi:two-component system alkaline phosphatase synthesis response regulator PhoP
MRKQGYEVDQAPDGKVALEKIRGKEPDMVIIGTEVKKVPGLDVIREIRETINPELPIIVIAPLEAEGDIMKAYQLGVNDFVTKPFKPVELVLRVRRQFEVKKR